MLGCFGALSGTSSYRWFLIAFFCFFFASCSEQTNFNKLWLSKQQNQALDVLLSKAQIEYDEGNYDKALEFAEDAQKISPNNELVAVLLGYIHLGLGGIDSFQLARGLIAAGKSSSSSLNLAAGSKGALETLDKLRPVLGIEDDDLLKLGKLDHDEENVAFEDYDLILPYSAPKARKSGLLILEEVNKAISIVCPFIDEAAKLDEDERHQCDITTNPRKNRTKSHFIWAFAHLSEALAFNAVILYKEADQDLTNMENRVEALKKEREDSSMSLTSYVDHVVALSTTVDKIFPVDDPDSQLQAVLNSLKTVSLAFAALPGMPKNVKRGIERAVDSIAAQKKKVSGVDNEYKEAAGLKAELNKKLATDLGKQIDTVAEEASAQELEDLCAAYKSVSVGTMTPKACEED